MLDEMENQWNECGGDLWSHEWGKHGSCMKSQVGTDEKSFFNITLTLFNKYFNLTEQCSEQECIIGCFDMNFDIIECE
jgi:ribonuclease I